jgi:hypothetical protein
LSIRFVTAANLHIHIHMPYARSIAHHGDFPPRPTWRGAPQFIEMPGAGGFLAMHEKKTPFAKGACKGWNALLTLHAFAVIARLAPAAGPKCGAAAMAFWWELCEHARGINGGLPLADQAKAFVTPTDSPRTLATYGWVKLTAAVLRLSRDTPDECAVVDELELSLINAAHLAGSVPAECSDELPIDGGVERRPAALEHAFLCGLGLLPTAASHAFSSLDNELTIHLHYAAEHKSTLPSGNVVRLTVDTQVVAPPLCRTCALVSFCVPWRH